MSAGRGQAFALVSQRAQGEMNKMSQVWHLTFLVFSFVAAISRWSNSSDSNLQADYGASFGKVFICIPNCNSAPGL
jgi:hypothetical protein